jgi:hypothetical protein
MSNTFTFNEQVAHAAGVRERNHHACALACMERARDRSRARGNGVLSWRPGVCASPAGRRAGDVRLAAQEIDIDKLSREDREDVEFISKAGKCMCVLDRPRRAAPRPGEREREAVLTGNVRRYFGCCCCLCTACLSWIPFLCLKSEMTDRTVRLSSKDLRSGTRRVTALTAPRVATPSPVRACCTRHQSPAWTRRPEQVRRSIGPRGVASAAHHPSPPPWAPRHPHLRANARSATCDRWTAGIARVALDCREISFS